MEIESLLVVTYTFIYLKSAMTVDWLRITIKFKPSINKNFEFN